MSHRAVSPVLGLALLVGMVAVASVSLLLLSTAITDSTRSTIDDQHAERSLSEFSQTAERLAKGAAKEGRYEIEGASDGTIRAIPDDGDEISVRVADGNDTTIFWINRTLGSVTYDAPDGSQLAYQGGGVWYLGEYGQAIMVEPPPFHYREEPEPTLTFPLTLVREDVSATGSTAGTIQVQERRRHYPDEPNHFNPLRNGSVTVSVDSLYCEGWEQYFRERTDGSVTESCESEGVTTDSEVRIELSVPFEIDGLEAGAQFNDVVDDAGQISGNYSDGGHTLTSPTRIVKSKIEDCRAGEGTDATNGTTMHGPGLYCIDSDAADDDHVYTVNASAGEVHLATDGPLPDGGLQVDGTENVSVFVDGDLFDQPGQGNDKYGNASDPAQTRIYVASGNEIEANAVNVSALVYAPTSDVDVAGQFDVQGGLVADDVDMKGNSHVSIDPSVMGISTSFQPGDANLYFLHVSETEIGFADD